MKKSPLMIGTFLGLWMLPLIGYGSRLVQLVATSRTVVELVLLVLYCAMLIIFWLLSAYYVAITLFSFLSKPLPSPPPNPGGEWPQVAILYPTCNDFQPEAATTCLNQDYPDFHLFLLDDSTKDEFRAVVDAFHKAHSRMTTVVRRPTRQGFKAGNLNHALRGAAAGYPLFVVVDADENLPSDFLRRTVPYLQDPDLAFVQANHAPNPDQDSSFARDIAPTILPFWHVHCPARNRYGFVVFVGHGAVVRRSAWEAVGGFPEVITEDLAFSAALGEKGMRGVFLEDLVCYEDFASDYLAFKRQQERYVVGVTQVIRKHLGSLLRSQGISLIEKIDFLLWCSPLYVPVLVLPFVALTGLGLAAAFGHWHVPVISVPEYEFVLPPIRTFGEPFDLLWYRDFQLLSVFCALSPALAAIALGLARRLNVVKLLFLSTVPYLSLMVVVWRGMLRYLLMGKISWFPTGENTTAWRPPIGWEVGIGALLTIASLMSLNFAFFAVSSCLLLGAGIYALGWENRFLRAASTACFIIILLQMLLNIVLPAQFSGLAPLVFPVHF